MLGRRPGRNGLSAVSEAQGQGLWTLAFASSWQTDHFASAIWKFLSAFALTLPLFSNSGWKGQGFGCEPPHINWTMAIRICALLVRVTLA
jgi:hypothetical protein